MPVIWQPHVFKSYFHRCDHCLGKEWAIWIQPFTWVFQCLLLDLWSWGWCSQAAEMQPVLAGLLGPGSPVLLYFLPSGKQWQLLFKHSNGEINCTSSSSHWNELRRGVCGGVLIRGHTPSQQGWGPASMQTTSVSLANSHYHWRRLRLTHCQLKTNTIQ